MRLIDADALMEILTTAIRNMKGMAKFLDAENDPEIQMEIKAYTDIANGIKEMPTIEPERKTDGDTISRQAAIDTEGLDAQIRCEMCRNPMHTDRGCDGNCKYDEKLYERIMQILSERIKTLPSVQPETCDTCKHGYFGDERCNDCRVRFTSHYERRTDEQTVSE